MNRTEQAANRFIYEIADYMYAGKTVNLQKQDPTFGEILIEFSDAGGKLVITSNTQRYTSEIQKDYNSNFLLPTTKVTLENISQDQPDIILWSHTFAAYEQNPPGTPQEIEVYRQIYDQYRHELHQHLNTNLPELFDFVND